MRLPTPAPVARSASTRAAVTLAAFAGLTVAAVAQGAPRAAELEGAVYLLAPNSQITRFEEYDRPNMEAALARLAPGLRLVVQSADNSPSRQLEQAQAAITEGARAILLAPPVANQAQSVVVAAHEAGIPVINFAYAAENADVDYYVTVPFEPIGVKVAEFVVQDLANRPKPLKLALVTGDPSFFFDREINKGWDKVLQPLIDAGEVQIVCRNDNLELSEENARVAVEGCIEQAGDGIDAVLVHNDSSANGALAALSAQGLLGKIKVYGGYDSQAGTIQHLLAGNLRNNMVPPYKAMAESAIALVVGILTDDPARESLVNGTYDNGLKAVPTVFNENVFITAENVQSELIDTGLLTKDEVCAGPAVGAPPCAD
jgi:D-xylose transport system substrate-binding protein